MPDSIKLQESLAEYVRSGIRMKASVLFDTITEHGHVHLDAARFSSAFREEINFPLSDKEVQWLFSCYDKDQDGRLNRVEFMRLMTIKLPSANDTASACLRPCCILPGFCSPTNHPHCSGMVVDLRAITLVIPEAHRKRFRGSAMAIRIARWLKKPGNLVNGSSDPIAECIIYSGGPQYVDPRGHTIVPYDFLADADGQDVKDSLTNPGVLPIHTLTRGRLFPSERMDRRVESSVPPDIAAAAETERVELARMPHILVTGMIIDKSYSGAQVVEIANDKSFIFSRSLYDADPQGSSPWLSVETSSSDSSLHVAMGVPEGCNAFTLLCASSSLGSADETPQRHSTVGILEAAEEGGVKGVQESYFSAEARAKLAERRKAKRELQVQAQNPAATRAAN